MADRSQSRWAWPAVGVLFAAAAAVAVTKVRQHASGPPGSRLPVERLTFPPPLPADTLDPQPTADDAASVARFVGDLSGPDAARADLAAVAVERLPFTDQPRLDRAGPGCPRLAELLPRIRARDKLARRRTHASDAIAAFYERQALSDYAVNGHTDPKWDAAAQTFLHLATVRFTLHRPAALAADLAEARRQLKLARDAGCDDPTVLVCGALLADDPDSAEATDLIHRADPPSGCGPLFRLILDGRLLRPLLVAAATQAPATRDRGWPLIGDRLRDMVDRFGQVVALPGVPPAVVDAAAENLLRRLVDARVQLQFDLHPFLKRYEAAEPGGSAMLSIKGQFYMAYAREATDATAYAERLSTAAAALQRAAELDPDEPTIAHHLLAACLARRRGAAAAAEWFGRDVAVDPDDAEAYQLYLSALDPQRGGGSPDKMIAFGRRCLAEGNWTTDIPTVLVAAHARCSAFVPNPAAYWRLPGVWEDCRAVFGGYVARGVDVTVNRNQLARYAVLCHQWRAADEQFRALGDAADPAGFGNGSAAALDEARRHAARLAGDPAAQGR